MGKVNHTNNRKVKLIHWPAHIIGTIVAGFWVLSLIVSSIAEIWNIYDT